MCVYREDDKNIESPLCNQSTLFNLEIILKPPPPFIANCNWIYYWLSGEPNMFITEWKQESVDEEMGKEFD